MATAAASLTPKGFANTSRLDNWRLSPYLQFIGFAAAIAYSTIAAAQGAFYKHEPYLSPFYSPTVIVDLNFWPFAGGPLSFLGPLIHPISPAFVILIFPLGFRLTCYYYRKMYYRSFFAEPRACAVGEGFGEESYSGETRFPFNLLNLHRYFMYAAMVILVILAYDLALSFYFEHGWGVGLGTVVLAVNVVALALFSLSCNSLRHIVGGNVDCFSCARFGQARYKGWKFVTYLNLKHREWAWISLATVCFADFYVRLIAGGIPGMTFVDPVLYMDLPILLAGLAAVGGVTAALAWKLSRSSAPGAAAE